MRLFTGIAIPEEIVQTLSRLLDRLRPTASIHWTPPYNFHITTKFIGPFPEKRLPDLNAALQPVVRRPPIPVKLQGLQWFPNASSPRILSVAVASPVGLTELAGSTEQALVSFGIPFESRKFSPHVTLARVKDPAVSLANLHEALAQLPSPSLGSFLVESFHLYESRPGPSGSIYTQLTEFALQQ